MNASMRGYFDYASATPVGEAVFSAMKPYLSVQSFYNPSAVYQKALDVRSDIDSSRSRIANKLGVKAQEIIFTSGCTEANNMAIHGVMTQYPNGKLLISAIEHDSILEPAKNYNHALVPVNVDGVLDLTALQDLLTEDVVLISIILASNEIGVIQPLREVGLLVKQERLRRGTDGLPLYLHTDAAQAANYMSINTNGLHVDMMSLNSGKVYGPKGMGCLYLSGSTSIRPLFYGGGQERGLRSGTENVAACIGFACALGEAQDSRESETVRLQKLQKILVTELEKQGGVLNGSYKKRLPNNIHMSFPGVDNERLVYELDQDGFMVSSGSACHARSGVSSNVLKAIGLTDTESKESIRITMGRFSTAEDVENLLAALTSRLAKNR